MGESSGAVARWPFWRLSGGPAYLILVGCWALLDWGLGRFSDEAYRLSIRVSYAGPTVLFLFLLVRHWFRRAAYSRSETIARLAGCLLACACAIWAARTTDLAYTSMDDAPRGLLWSFNIVLAPLAGMVAILVARLVGWAASRAASRGKAADQTVQAR